MSEIQKFYSGQSVLITGVSGFLGKAVLQKLLRSCSEVVNVYVLIRTKYGMDPESRLKRIIQSPIFDTLKMENPSALSKIVAIGGDIGVEDLGIEQSDRDRIRKNVSIVIHSAASVKFNEPIKTAMKENYTGTGHILDLCRELDSLSTFVHVSTAYANCDHKDISEEVIKPKQRFKRPEQIIAMSDEELVQLTPKIIGEKPNTYSYAKCEAEIFLEEQRDQLPICIVRPSIIGAAWKEPQPGYVDSINGVTGLMAAAGKGMLTSLVCDKDRVSDIIPLDVTVNLILASAWKTSTERPSRIPIYNCCSGTLNSITNEDVRKLTLAGWEKVPLDTVLRRPYFTFTTSHFIHFLINLIFNYPLYLLLDGLAALTGQKSGMISMFNKVLTSTSAMTYFHMNEWQFETNNMLILEESMSLRDRELFFWNIRDLKWEEYFENYCVGIKSWIFKEDVKNLPNARVRMNRMYWWRMVRYGTLLFLGGFGAALFAM